jgi:uncharacterized membrane protein YozB (DUF420 family)
MPYAQPQSTTAIEPVAAAIAVPGRIWWRRPWIAPLALVATAFVVLSVPRYLSLDPARSRIPAPESFAAYYPMLVGHVFFASFALLTAPLQVWPWFRQRYRTTHRLIGRIYVFGGVLPAGLLGLAIGAVSPFGPLIRVSNVLLAALWLACTIAGYRMVRQRRYDEHRKWMIRSFALTMSIITNRAWAMIWFVVLTPHLQTTFEGNEKMLFLTVAGLTSWMGWVIPLLVAQWWLERTPTAAS